MTIKAPWIRIPGRNGLAKKGHIEVTKEGKVQFFPYETKPGREPIPYMELNDSIEENLTALKAVVASLEALP